MENIPEKVLHTIKVWILLDLREDNWRAIVQPG